MENDVQENKKMMILVAEDDVFLSNVYNKKLTKEGFDVCMAANGEEAITLAKEKKPDIILLDLIMPVKDGFQTLKDLKEDPEMKNTKVIIFSNLSQEEDRQKVMEMGAVDYFVKANISFREVINIIKRHLNIA
jgi:two-component system, OmpR family, alkaline phosphatase synthesis response regulator PhoP